MKTLSFMEMLSPHNLLLSSNGVALIDSLCLNDGEISPGLSPDWTAPEQLMMQPVSKATDIYPLGLMLCMILGADLTGEYLQYVLPSRSEEPLMVPILRNPILYLGPKDGKLTFAGRRDWFTFLEACLRFIPQERPSNIQIFANELERLCKNFPVEGKIVLEIESVLLPQFALFPDQKERPCRLLMDEWSSLTRPSIEEY